MIFGLLKNTHAAITLHDECAAWIEIGAYGAGFIPPATTVAVGIDTGFPTRKANPKVPVWCVLS
jgi:hypothetical protein